MEFTYTHGALYFDVRNIPSTCGSILPSRLRSVLLIFLLTDLRFAELNIDADSPALLKTPAGETAIKLSMTNSFRNLNCILGHVFFRIAGGSSSSDRQLSNIGGISSLKVLVRKAIPTFAFETAHRISILFDFISVVRVPNVQSHFLEPIFVKVESLVR